ncbi:MAG: hypothetical protein HYU97_02985 [Deltaproteobacteria bacterium]|nr:hypothetical protein [Deltaproteobacteria bacterium]
MRRSIVVIIVFLFIPLLISSQAYTHPGRTAADGCHYCRTRCDYWGVPWYERHCHNSKTGKYFKFRNISYEITNAQKSNSKNISQELNISIATYGISEIN